MTIERVKNVLADHLDKDVSEFTPETTFEDLGVDSLESVEILMEMEDEFGIEIKAAEVGKSVQALADYIDAKLA